MTYIDLINIAINLFTSLRHLDRITEVHAKSMHLTDRFWSIAEIAESFKNACDGRRIVTQEVRINSHVISIPVESITSIRRSGNYLFEIFFVYL